MTWTDNGHYYFGDHEKHSNLIEVRDPLEVMVVVNCRNEIHGTSSLALEYLDQALPKDAPHTLRKFREVIE